MPKTTCFRSYQSALVAATSAVNLAHEKGEDVTLVWRGIRIEVMPGDKPGIIAVILENGGTLPSFDVELVPEVMTPPSAFDCTRDGHFPRLGV